MIETSQEVKALVRNLTLQGCDKGDIIAMVGGASSLVFANVVLPTSFAV